MIHVLQNLKTAFVNFQDFHFPISELEGPVSRARFSSSSLLQSALGFTLGYRPCVAPQSAFLQCSAYVTVVELTRLLTTLFGPFYKVKACAQQSTKAGCQRGTWIQSSLGWRHQCCVLRHRLGPDTGQATSSRDVEQPGIAVCAHEALGSGRMPASAAWGWLRRRWADCPPSSPEGCCVSGTDLHAAWATGLLSTNTANMAWFPLILFHGVGIPCFSSGGRGRNVCLH